MFKTPAGRRVEEDNFRASKTMRGSMGVSLYKGLRQKRELSFFIFVSISQPFNMGNVPAQLSFPTFTLLDHPSHPSLTDRKRWSSPRELQISLPTSSHFSLPCASLRQETKLSLGFGEENICTKYFFLLEDSRKKMVIILQVLQLVGLVSHFHLHSHCFS